MATAEYSSFEVQLAVNVVEQKSDPDYTCLTVQQKVRNPNVEVVVVARAECHSPSVAAVVLAAADVVAADNFVVSA